MKRKHQRLLFTCICLLLFSGAVVVVVHALQENLLYFYTPLQLQQTDKPLGHKMRLGGQVQKGSFQQNGDAIFFTVADGAAEVRVVYTGALPDLFGEGRGVVAEGLWQGGTFQATRILAKHDERYMPPEAAVSAQEPAS